MQSQRNQLDLTTDDLLQLCRRYARMHSGERTQLDETVSGGLTSQQRGFPSVTAWLDEAAAYTTDDDAAHLAAQLRTGGDVDAR